MTFFSMHIENSCNIQAFYFFSTKGENEHSKLLYEAYDEFYQKGKCEKKETAAIFQELSSNSTPMMLLKLWTIILANAFEIAKQLDKKVTLKEYQVKDWKLEWCIRWSKI